METGAQSLLILWLVVTLQGIVLFSLLYRMGKNPNLVSALPPGGRIPDFPLATLQGEQVRLRGILTGTTMLCAVTNNCVFCHRIIPELERLAQSGSKISITLLIANDLQGGAEFLQTTGTSLPAYMLDPDMMRTHLRVATFPFGFLVDERGMILRRERLSRETIITWLVDIPKVVHVAEAKVGT